MRSCPPSPSACLATRSRTPRRPSLPEVDPLAALALATDTTDAAFDARLRVEHARLRSPGPSSAPSPAGAAPPPARPLPLALHARPRLPRRLVPGLRPHYAAIARWPGDTWGLTRLVEPRPAPRPPPHPPRRGRHRASPRPASTSTTRAVSSARPPPASGSSLGPSGRPRAPSATSGPAPTPCAPASASRPTSSPDASTLQRELLRLAEMKYDQGEIDYEALARQRAALLAAEHAHATNAARLAALDAGG